ncbi:MAG TPA: hypothetical protein PKC67_12780 [Kiritimatiellia bacterium]|nr:hypothetical protein [Kiritimatiellia bacterium]HMP35211.1 hypothetical protein [Kiritimatiellia bacterium]
MNRRYLLAMLGRVVLAFALMAVLVYGWPAVWVRILAPVTNALTAASFPYVEDAGMRADGATLIIEGAIALDLTMANGQPLPAVPGTWKRGAGTTLNLLVIGVAVFAAPSVRWRDRLRGVPVLVVGLLLVGAFHLTIEVQEAALRHLGYQWLPTLPLAGTEANAAAFQAMEGRFRVVAWIKSFNDAGGAMFLAVLAGLGGYAATGGWRSPRTEPAANVARGE